MYLEEGRLFVEKLPRGFAWLDTGTFDSLLDAANMINSIQSNKDRVICCPEVIAYQNGWLDDNGLEERANLLQKNSYGKYLNRVLNKKRK